MQIFCGLMIPFLGTALGAFLVFFLTKELKGWIEQSMMGFAAGVMAAASVWSLLIPAMELEAHLGKFSFFPAAVGFSLGMLFLAGTDWIVRRIKKESKRKSLMVLAVTIHNIPEGLSVGAAFAGFLGANTGIAAVSAFALAVGIGVQNIPEGFIVAMPYRRMGKTRKRSFVYGTLSGAVEPLAALLMILLTAWIAPLLPWLLAFSAGAMFYVILEELIPEAMEDRRYHWGTAGFCVGFLLMMILDVALG